MKLIHPELSQALDCSQPGIQTLVVENKDFLRRLLADAYIQKNGNPGTWILAQNDKIVDFAKNVELISNYFETELNRHSLISKITTALENEATSEEFFESSIALISKIEQYMNELAFSLPGDIHFPKLSMNSLLKAAGPEIADEYDNCLERMLDYFELVREYDRDKLFITVNLRSFFSDEDTSLFLDSAISHEYHIIMIESHAFPVLPQEHRLTVDEDLCEF